MFLLLFQIEYNSVGDMAMKRVVQIFVVTLIIALIGQSFIQAGSQFSQKNLLRIHEDQKIF